jgi:hypothetical protein
MIALAVLWFARRRPTTVRAGWERASMVAKRVDAMRDGSSSRRDAKGGDDEGRRVGADSGGQGGCRAEVGGEGEVGDVSV